MSDRILVGTRKGLFALTRAGAGNWRIGAPSFLGDPVTAAVRDPHDGTLYASLNLGHFGVKMRRSSDDGRTWEETAVPSYPPQPESLPARPDGSAGVPWKLVQVWVMESGGAGVLLAGTNPGGLFRSTDRGDSWQLFESLWNRPERANWFGGGYDSPGIHSICVNPRDNKRLAVGVSTGGVWTSADGGATWKIGGKGMYAEYMPSDQRDEPNVQDVYRMVQAPTRPEVLWVQHHNGVFRSTDRAAGWREVKAIRPSKFGFAVAAHPAEADTAWFVPAVKDECRVPVNVKLVVARTRDGGKSFTVLRKGLPQEHAYDLVYRHGLDVDATGRRLVIGSTTGGVWISEDGGDSWKSVSTQLPPVYFARFDPGAATGRSRKPAAKSGMRTRPARRR